MREKRENELGLDLKKRKKINMALMKNKTEKARNLIEAQIGVCH